MTAPLAFLLAVATLVWRRRSRRAWVALAVSGVGLWAFCNSLLLYSSLDLPAPLNRWQFEATAPLRDEAWLDYPDAEVLAARGDRSPYGYTSGAVHLRSTRPGGFDPHRIETFAARLGWTLEETVPIRMTRGQVLVGPDGRQSRSELETATLAEIEEWERLDRIQRVVGEAVRSPSWIQRDSVAMMFDAPPPDPEDSRRTFVILTDDRREMAIYTSLFWP